MSDSDPDNTPHAPRRDEDLDATDRRTLYNSLLCLLDGLSGSVISVELRNECSVTGTLQCLDKAMTLCMLNVTFYDMFDNAENFETFRVQGKLVRFVHIPDEVDMVRAMESSLDERRRRHAKVNSGRVPSRGRGGRGRGRGHGERRGGRGRGEGVYATDRAGAKERFRKWFEEQHGRKDPETQPSTSASNPKGTG